MTKSAFTDWDSTAANNTDIGGINIAEACAAANINNAIREAMAQLASGIDGKMKRYVKGAGYTALTTDNNAVLEFSGAYTLALTAASTLGANWHCIVYANGGAVTVDPNSTELIDGASTISVSDGSSTLIFCTGTAFESTPLSPDLSAYLTTATAASTYLPIAEAWESVASATTTDLSATSSNVLITGTTTITGLGTVSAGTKRYIRFNSALTFTHNATSLILPSEANITTAANDRCIAVSLGSGNWIVISYTKADGSALVAKGGSPNVILEDQKTAGTNGGTFTSGAWQTRDMNTIVLDPDGLVTLSSNAFTFSVDGYLEFEAPAYTVGGHRARLYNVTDAVVVYNGLNSAAPNTAGTLTRSVGGCSVVAGKQYRLEHRCNATSSTNGFGLAVNYGVAESYSRIRFWRS